MDELNLFKKIQEYHLAQCNMVSSDIKQIFTQVYKFSLQFSNEGSQVRYKEIKHKKITLQKQ